jgi:hypothetical protein
VGDRIMRAHAGQSMPGVRSEIRDGGKEAPRAAAPLSVEGEELAAFSITEPCSTHHYFRQTCESRMRRSYVLHPVRTYTRTVYVHLHHMLARGLCNWDKDRNTSFCNAP